MSSSLQCTCICNDWYNINTRYSLMSTLQSTTHNWLRRRAQNNFVRKPKLWAANKIKNWWQKYRTKVTYARRRTNVIRNAKRRDWELNHPIWSRRQGAGGLSALQRQAIRQQYMRANRLGYYLPRSSVMAGIDKASNMNSLKGPYAMTPFRIKQIKRT